MADHFWLDPDYRDQAAKGKIRLKFKTLAPGSWIGYGCWFVVACVTLIIGLILGEAGLEVLNNTLQFTFNGVEIIAVVVDCQYIPPEHKVAAKNVLTLNYPLKSDPSKRITGNITVQGAGINYYSCHEFMLQGQLHIVYLPDAPAKFRVADSGLAIQPFADLFGAISGILIAFFGIVGLYWLLVRQIQRIGRWFRLQRHSELRDGTIIGCKVTLSMLTGKTTAEIITYQFTSPNGTVISGKQRARRDDRIRKQFPAPGTPVSVLYADDHAYYLL